MMKTDTEAIAEGNEVLKKHTIAIKDDTQLIRSEVSCLRTQAENAELLEILEWLSPSNYPAQQFDIMKRKQEDTVQWFLNAPELSEWLAKPHATLFCPGIPGAGKTVVSATLVDHLSHMVQDDSIGIAYIYCNYKSKKDQDASKMLAAILKQLVQGRPSLLEPVKRLHTRHAGKGTRPSLSETVEVLRDTSASYTTIYVVVDALDEYQDDEGARHEFLTRLTDLQINQDVRLMATSRFIPSIMDMFNKSTKLEIRASKQDIQKFIAGQIHRLPKCIQIDPGLQADIQESTAEAAGGMSVLLHMPSIPMLKILGFSSRGYL